MDESIDRGGDDEGPLTRSEMELLRRADRDCWPVPVGVQVKLLQRLVDMTDPETERGALVSERTAIAAIRTIGALRSLRLRQEAIDLARAKFEHEKAAGTPDAGGAGPAGVVIYLPENLRDGGTDEADRPAAGAAGSVPREPG